MYLTYQTPVLLNLIKGFIVVGFVEEFLKLLVVRHFAFKNHYFDEVMDGIVYTVMASLGFACFENILFVINTGVEVALIRAFTAVPLHAISSGIMGYYIGKAKFEKTRSQVNKNIYLGLLFAVLIHGFYDFLLFSIPVFGLLPSTVIAPLIIFGFIRLNKLIKSAIDDDVSNGRTLVGAVAEA
jgi:RsiW-degrading membrane proteinase PrsW (M82 family)